MRMVSIINGRTHLLFLLYVYTLLISFGAQFFLSVSCALLLTLRFSAAVCGCFSNSSGSPSVPAIALALVMAVAMPMISLFELSDTRQ